MQVQFNTRTILPSVYRTEKDGKQKVYLSTTVFSPQRYNLTPSAGVMPVEQIEAVLAECADNAQEVEIQFVITDTDLKGPAGLTPISSSWDCLPLWKWIPCIPPPDRQKHCLLSFLQGKSCFLLS